MKTIVQCDFDGTITKEDVSFLLLDEFADGDWRKMLKEYQKGRIAVGSFNTIAFAMIKADKQTLLDFTLRSGRVGIRPGLPELLSYCSKSGFEFTIVSNGQDFYIDALLKEMGISGVQFYAATSRFTRDGLAVDYIGPDGNIATDCFKESYTRLFISQGYQVIYIGNGVSDVQPAQLSRHVFATGDMLQRCQELDLKCIPFGDLHDVVKGLELLQKPL